MTPLLSLVQWLSPAFPTGGFAYSHGLEQVVSDGDIRSGADLVAWLGDVLAHGAGWQDAVLLAHTLKAGDDAALAELALALQPSAERLRETMEQGTALARTVAALTGRDLPPAPLPVALGMAARPLGLPPEQVIALYLHSFAANLVSAAIRFVPLGQTDGQGALAALHGLIGDLAGRAALADLDDIGTATLGADLAAMRHETLDVRIFKT